MPERMRWKRRGESPSEGLVVSTLTQRLRNEGYGEAEIQEVILPFLWALDGVWSWGTVRMIVDLDRTLQYDSQHDRKTTKRSLRMDLRSLDWSTAAIVATMAAIDSFLPGVNSEITPQVMADLNSIFWSLTQQFGEPPDHQW